MRPPTTVLVALALSIATSLVSVLGFAEAKAKEPNAVTAIDIQLEPDATMIKDAKAANERLLKSFPKGFALGESHRPHISCLQRYVKTADLDKVYAAILKVLNDGGPLKLMAYRYHFIPGEGALKENGIGILIEPTDTLIEFQQKLIDAVAPFTVKTGTAAAFATTKEESDIHQRTITYVENFVPNETGNKFNPHITIGIASRDYLRKMLDEKPKPHTCYPVGVSVCQLGNSGTAPKKLKRWRFIRQTPRFRGS